MSEIQLQKCPHEPGVNFQKDLLKKKPDTENGEGEGTAASKMPLPDSGDLSAFLVNKRH